MTFEKQIIVVLEMFYLVWIGTAFWILMTSISLYKRFLTFCLMSSIDMHRRWWFAPALVHPGWRANFDHWNLPKEPPLRDLLSSVHSHWKNTTSGLIMNTSEWVSHATNATRGVFNVDSSHTRKRSGATWMSNERSLVYHHRWCSTVLLLRRNTISANCSPGSLPVFLKMRCTHGRSNRLCCRECSGIKSITKKCGIHWLGDSQCCYAT